MESSYILILLVFLIILLVGIVFFGYRQLTQMSMLVNQHSSAIDALRNFLNRMLEPPPQEQYDEYDKLVQQQRELQPTNDAVDETLEEPADDEEFSDMNIEEHIEKEIQTSNDSKDEAKKVEESTKFEEVKEVKKVEEPSISEVSAISETPKEDIKEISIHPQIVPAPVITDEKKDGDVVVEDVKIIEVKGKDGKIKQKFPTESPKDLPIGTVRMFENKEYVVFETVTGIRRWKLQGK